MSAQTPDAPVEYPESGKLVTWSDLFTDRTGFVVGPFSWMPADRVAVRATDGTLYSLAPDRLADWSCPTCQAVRAQDHAPACDRRPAHVWVVPAALRGEAAR